MWLMSDSCGVYTGGETHDERVREQMQSSVWTFTDASAPTQACPCVRVTSAHFKCRATLVEDCNALYPQELLHVAVAAQALQQVDADHQHLHDLDS